MARSTANLIYEIEERLPGILEGRLNPMPTRVLAEKLAEALGDETTDDIAACLLKLAPRHPRATHNGVTRMRFGRTMTGWLWNPTAAPASVPILTPGLLVTAPPPVVESWDVAPALKEGYVLGRCLVCKAENVPTLGRCCDPCDSGERS